MDIIERGTFRKKTVFMYEQNLDPRTIKQTARDSYKNSQLDVVKKVDHEKMIEGTFSEYHKKLIS